MLRLLPENIWGFLLSDSAELLARMLKDSQPLANFGQINATSTAAEADAFTPFIQGTKPRRGMKLVNTGTIDPLESLWGKSTLTHGGKRILTPWLNVSEAPVNERRLAMYMTPKIIFAKMAANCECFVDWDGEYASVNTNCFYQPLDPVDLAYVAGFCNSHVFMYLYKQFFGSLRMSGGYFQFQAPQLRVIPLRNTNGKIKRQVSELLDKVRDDGVTSQLKHEVIQKLNDIFSRVFELSSKDRAVVEVK